VLRRRSMPLRSRPAAPAALFIPRREVTTPVVVESIFSFWERTQSRWLTHQAVKLLREHSETVAFLAGPNDRTGRS
jgi:hypothetical protein